MKAAERKQTENNAIKAAKRYFFSGKYYYEKNVIPWKNRPALDRRTIFSRVFMAELFRLSHNPNTCDASRIGFEKNVQRRKDRAAINGDTIHKPGNVLTNKLYLDWKRNRPFVKVFPNRLQFDGWRNHWAKNEQDLKVLAILAKY